MCKLQRLITAQFELPSNSKSTHVQALENTDMLHELCLSWHQQQQRHVAWLAREAEIQGRRCAV